ncbi:MAG: serine/threonine-protein kinase [Methylococcales bacterium]
MDAGYPVDALPVGTTLDHDRYEIISILGRGTFGITYLAKDQLGRDVAIKEFFPTGYVSRDHSSTVHSTAGEQGDIFHDGLKKFLGEAKTIARFKHPNLVHILTYFEQNGTGYITMGYESGEDLNTYLQNHNASEQYLINLFTPICSGLDLLHRAGYIHRDIKTANIRIRNDGSPVLLDFGAARDIFTSRPDHLTRIYTQSYAPYEQISPGWAEQGPKTDIYALAVTLYYAVSKKMPANAQARASALMNGKSDPYEPLATDAQHGFSPEFLTAINNAMNFDPDKRPASVLEWAQQLSGGSTSEEKPTPSTGLEKAKNANTTSSSPPVEKEVFSVASLDETKVNQSTNTEKTTSIKFWRIAFPLTIALTVIGGAIWYIIQDIAPATEASEAEPDNDGAIDEIQSSLFLTTNHGDQPQYQQNEKIEFLVTSDKNLFVYCFYQEEKANLFRMFPNADQPDALIAKGVTITIPSPHNSLEAGEAGHDSFQCFGIPKDIANALSSRLNDNGGMQPITAMTLPEVKDFITAQNNGSVVETAEIPITIE